jgi:RNA polymerase sigma-70 factor, ECF subfamily
MTSSGYTFALSFNTKWRAASDRIIQIRRAAMNELFQRIEQEIPRLRRYARALTRDVSGADDLVQDCLTRGLAKAHLWQEGTDLRAWLFTILHNQHVNRVRRSIREGVAVNGSDVEPSISASQYSRIELRDLERALARLPEEQRQVVLLVGLEGMRYETVAEIMGVPVGTVRSRLSRGREALRRMMGGEAELRQASEAKMRARRAQSSATPALPLRACA